MATSTHTDPVRIEPPQQASALLTQIAARMFDRMVTWTDGDPLPLTPEAMKAWKKIREIALLYASHGLLYLNPELLAELTDAVIYAHHLYHGMEPNTPVPGACDCELAILAQKAMRVVFSAALELDEAKQKEWGLA